MYEIAIKAFIPGKIVSEFMTASSRRMNSLMKDFSPERLRMNSLFEADAETQSQHNHSEFFIHCMPRSIAGNTTDSREI